MSALNPGALQALDTSMMRSIYWFDRQLSGELANNLVNAQLDAKGSPSISIISLRPAAWSHYLDRTTPVPRLRLACLLYALGKSLDSLNLTRAVIGIDIDVTPVQTLNQTSGDHRILGTDPNARPDEAQCRKEFAAANGPSSTETQAMELAIATLANGRCVVAIALPRFDQSALDQSKAGPATQARNGFIRDLRSHIAASHGQAPPPCVAFASPNIVQVTHEAVYQYQTKRRSVESSTGGSPVQGKRTCESSSTDSCSLGRTLGALLYEMRNGDDAEACGRQCRADSYHRFEIPEASPASYEHRIIDLGPARWTIAFDYVDAPDGTAPSGDILAQAIDAFEKLQPSDIYILTADSGTMEDKFLVPVSDTQVPGAWVHAAVALTEYRELGRKLDPPDKFTSYFGHVLHDIGLASLAALVLHTALGRIREWGSEVLRDVFLALTPVGVLLLFLGGSGMLVARHFASGDEWHSPLPILLGMCLHSYIELAHHPLQPEPKPVPYDAAGKSGRFARWWSGTDFIRILAQYFWCFAIILAALAGTGTSDLSRQTTWLLAAALSLAYWLACFFFDRLPLPWRPHVADLHADH